MSDYPTFSQAARDILAPFNNDEGTPAPPGYRRLPRAAVFSVSDDSAWDETIDIPERLCSQEALHLSDSNRWPQR